MDVKSGGGGITKRKTNRIIYFFLMFSDVINLPAARTTNNTDGVYEHCYRTRYVFSIIYSIFILQRTKRGRYQRKRFMVDIRNGIILEAYEECR